MTKLAFNKVINKSIKFEETNHVYKLYNKDGKYEKDLISGTTFISKFFPKFARDLIASRIAKRDNREVKDILTEWDNTSKIATDFGTRIHSYAENYVVNKDIPNFNTTKEEKYFNSVKSFIDNTLQEGWELLSAEKILFNNNIAGTVDLIMINHDKRRILIGDWKTNKRIELTSFSGNEYGFKPLEVLQNCSYQKYMLQLGLYTRLLESGKEYSNYKKYTIENKVLHITDTEVVEYVPSFDYKHYTKKMEQEYFKIRVR